MSDLSRPEQMANTCYNDYDEWKGWKRYFTVSKEDCAYFEGECRGVRLEDASVFEIGFGSGNFLAWARGKGARVVGCEINRTSIEAAQAAGIELLPTNFEAIAGGHADRFDTVVAFDVFEHFTLGEIIRKLAALEVMVKPGGHVLMRFPNAQSPFGLAPQNGDPTHKSALSREIFELLLQATGFEIVRYAGSYRINGGGIVRGAVRLLRSCMRHLISRILNFAYTTRIPYDPVVVIVVRLRAHKGGA